MAIHDPGRESQCFFPEPLALNLFLALALSLFLAWVRFRLSCLFRPVATVLSHGSLIFRFCSQLAPACPSVNSGFYQHMPVVFAALTLLQRSERWGESLPSLSQLG